MSEESEKLAEAVQDLAEALDGRFDGGLDETLRMNAENLAREVLNSD